MSDDHPPMAKAWGNRVGLAMAAVAVVAVPAVAVAAWYREWAVLLGLGVPLAVGAAGGVLAWACRGPSDRPGPGRAPLLAVVWLLATAVAAMPFVVAAHASEEASSSLLAFRSPLNAGFEAMSGLTTSGLTVASEPESLPRGLLWWRSTLQWLGGVGLIYLALSLANLDGEQSNEDDDEDADDELGSGEEGQHGASLRRLLWRTWVAYGLLTLAAFVAYFLTGMGAWDAANHAQTAVSTGGFSTRAASLDAFGRPAQVVTLVFVVLGALSFAALRPALLAGDVGAVFRDAQARWFAAVALVGAGLLWWASALPGWDAAFQWVSALCTGGFGTVKLGRLPDLTLALLIPAMVVGACAGSTCGGIKIARLRRLIRWGTGKPTADDALSETRGQTLQVAAAFVASLVLGALLLRWAVPGPGFAEICFETASALGNAGLTAGVTSAEMPAAGRVILFTLMWLGRLEFVLLVELLLRKDDGG